MDELMLFGDDGKRDLCDDINADYIPRKLDDIELQIDRLKQRWGEFTYLIGQRLKYIHENALYEENNYPSFKTYITIALKMSENNAYYYIAVYDYFTQEQTKRAGSKLKLIIPLLNKLKKDKTLPDEFKEVRINKLRDELYYHIKDKTYREAESTIKEMKGRYFNELHEIEKFERIKVKRDRVIIFEDDENLQKKLIEHIESFYQ